MTSGRAAPGGLPAKIGFGDTVISAAKKVHFLRFIRVDFYYIYDNNIRSKIGFILLYFTYRAVID